MNEITETAYAHQCDAPDAEHPGFPCNHPEPTMDEITETYIREITLVIANDEGAHQEAQEAAMLAINTDLGYSGGTDADSYDDIHRNRPHEAAEVVGLAITEHLRYVATSQSTGLAQALLLELTNNLSAGLGEAFLPEPEDYREWVEGQDR